MWSQLIEIYQNNFGWNFVLMPLISGIIGWGTNVLALKMTFYPLEYKGVKIKGKKILGWQGIVPEKAASMASRSVDMITTKLINVEDQFERLDPKRISEQMQPAILELTRDIFDDSLNKEFKVWKLLPDKQKEIIFKKATKEIPQVIEEIMKDLKKDIIQIFNIKKMAVDHLMENKILLNKIFLEVGHREFKFIEISGFYFGVIFGFIQLLIWIPFQYWLILPVGGLIVGYLTNWIALQLIFNPVKEVSFLGLKFQGLFIKRQKEVSSGYSKIIAENIMTMPRIFDAIYYGPSSDKLMQILEKHFNEGIDRSSGYTGTILKLTKGTETYERIKSEAVRRLIQAVPEQIDQIFEYSKEALDIEYTLNDKMSKLPPQDFVGFLRPVFQEDEWKLILVGAILGLVAGLIQIFVS